MQASFSSFICVSNHCYFLSNIMYLIFVYLFSPPLLVICTLPTSLFIYLFVSHVVHLFFIFFVRLLRLGSTAFVNIKNLFSVVFLGQALKVFIRLLIFFSIQFFYNFRKSCQLIIFCLINLVVALLVLAVLMFLHYILELKRLIFLTAPIRRVQLLYLFSITTSWFTFFNSQSLCCQFLRHEFVPTGSDYNNQNRSVVVLLSS